MKESPDADTIPALPSGTAAHSGRLELEPLDPQITSIQPGGGVCMRIELAWGVLRRAWLKTFRRGYVARMRELRQGDENKCPHEVLDPRDIKFYRNQGGYYWAKEHDPFAGRDNWPFARAGLAELMLLPGLAFLIAAALWWVHWSLTAIVTVIGLCLVWFFRNPRRVVPTEPGLVVSPADGVVTTIEVLEHDEFLGGPGVLIGIFLSVFNVHINRVPVDSRVIGVRYRRGKMLNALRPESARENEQIAVRLEEDYPPYRRMIVRQITGALARRIVCWVKPGDRLARGEQFGMIKLGSRTELVLPRDPDLVIDVTLGQAVKAGSTVLARYTSSTEETGAK